MKVTQYHLVSFLIIILFISCDIFNSNDQGIEYYTIKVNSISGPDSVYVGDTIIFKLDGYVGTNGCHMFSHYDDKIESQKVKLSVWGKFTKGEICTDAEVYLDGKEYRVKTSLPGTFQLQIMQPDNTILVKSVAVKQLQP